MSGNSWQSYVDNMMAHGICEDAAVLGYLENKAVWASHGGGCFHQITPDQIKQLASTDHEELLTNGLTIGVEKCSVIRDHLFKDGDFTMDLRTKATKDGQPTVNISIGKAGKTMVLVKGKEGIHGGGLNKIVFDMAKYLREAYY
ncbi:profilin-2-like [Festucalex cinctus]